MDANFGPEVRELGRGLRDGSQRTADTTRWYKGLMGNSGAGRVKWDRSWGEVGIPRGINNMKGPLKQSGRHVSLCDSQDQGSGQESHRSTQLSAVELEDQDSSLTDGCPLSA